MPAITNAYTTDAAEVLGAGLSDGVVPAPGSLFWELLQCAAKAGSANDKDANRRLRVHRRRILLRWLSLKLEEQTSDLSRFLATQTPAVRALLARSLPRMVLNLIPPDIASHERELFVSDVSVAIELAATGI
jgi:hypothetical protein